MNIGSVHKEYVQLKNHLIQTKYTIDKKNNTILVHKNK